MIKTMLSSASYYETKKMQILWNKFCIFNNFSNLELCLNSDAANMESGYIIFICMTNLKSTLLLKSGSPQEASWKGAKTTDYLNPKFEFRIFHCFTVFSQSR